MTILIVAGGTGGHIFPALAVAKEFRKRDLNISWLGRDNSLEKEVSEKEGFNFLTTKALPFRGKGIFLKLFSILYLIQSFFSSLLIIYKIKPKFIFSSGSFISLAPGIAAFCLRVPLFIHEQNSIPGTSNKILSKLSTIIFEGFEGSFGKKGVKYVGNPIREEIVKLADRNKSSSTKGKRLNLLVLGGSQGSTQLNEIVMESLGKIKDKNAWKVLHQTGEGDSNRIQRKYRALGIEFELKIFIKDMANAYKNSDLVISRAGAMTIAEVCIMRKPSILFPLPWAIDNHQFYNAQFLKKNGAAEVLESSNKSISPLTSFLEKLSIDKKHLEMMSKSCSRISLPESSKEILRIIDEYFK